MRGRVPRIDADHLPATIPLQSDKQPSGRATRLQPDPLDGRPGRGDKACNDLRIGRQLALSHDLPLPSKMQSALSFIETSMAM